jgi:TonB family protein
MGLLLLAVVGPLLGQDATRDTIAQRPIFTPFTRAPQIKDEHEALRIVDRYYPEDLKDHAIGGTVGLWVRVGADGQVKNALVDWTSGNRQLDGAAIAAVREIRFIPAENLKKAVAVWVQIPIQFRVDVGRPADVVRKPPVQLIPLDEDLPPDIPQCSCEPPSGVYWRQLAAAEPVDEILAGDYALTVVATSGFRRDTIAYGTLRLRPTDVQYRRAPNPEVTYPLYGSADIDLGPLGPISLESPPTSRDPEHPGVTGVHFEASLKTTLVLGTGLPKGVTFDAGVLLDVFSIDSLGFSGRWKDGGAQQSLDPNHPRYRAPRLEGYFCARRFTTTR